MPPHMKKVRGPKNSRLEIDSKMGSKPSHTSFKLSNASQRYNKKKTYKGGTRGKQDYGRGRSGRIASARRYVLEKNSFQLGGKHQLNERNFYEYLGGIPSLKKKEGEILFLFWF